MNRRLRFQQSERRSRRSHSQRPNRQNRHPLLQRPKERILRPLLQRPKIRILLPVNVTLLSLLSAHLLWQSAHPVVVQEDTAVRLLENPIIQTESGFYQDEVRVEISCPEGLTVHYTLDGSDPTEASPVYTEALTLTDPSASENVYASRTDITTRSAYAAPESPVDKAVILRAAAFDGKGNASGIVTETYLIDFDDKEGYENICILSLVTDPDNLFDEENGIYVLGTTYENALSQGLVNENSSWEELLSYTNYNRTGKSSEQEAQVQLFAADGSLTLNTLCGIRIRGNESRSFPQKSFTLFARSPYNTAAFAPVLFDSEIAYPDLIVNGSRTVRKVLFSSLAADRDIAVQAYTPCQVFLNGEYWGLYYLMEKYSSAYLAGRYDVNAEDTLIIKNTRYVQEGGDDNISYYRELRNELTTEDFSDTKAYHSLLTQMDMQSFLDWVCTNIYIANTDTEPLGNNVFTWRTFSTSGAGYNDGRWRWMLYDTDDTLAEGMDLTGREAWSVDSFVEGAGYGGYLEMDPLPQLLKNEDFRRQFALTFMDLANENFSPDRVNALVDELEDSCGEQADLSWNRWNTNPLYTDFSTDLEEIRDFFAHRYDAIVPCLKEHLALEGELAKVTLSVYDPEGGTIQLNTITPDLSEGTWSGSYYTDYAITLQAVPAEGRSFGHWVVNGEILTEESIEVTLTGDTRIRVYWK